MENQRLKRQSGQAVLEYVLLLFVIVTIFLAFILGLAEGTRRFADNYFGAYFQCLLETGELPSLGSESGSGANSECNEEFQEFSIAGGRPPVSTDITAGAVSNNSSDLRNSSSSDYGGSGAGSESASVSGAVPINSGEGFGSNGFGRTQKIPIAKNFNGSKTNSEDSNAGGLISNATGDSTADGAGSGVNGSAVTLSGRSGSAAENSGAPPLVAITPNKDDEKDLRETKRVPAAAAVKKEADADVDTSLTLPNFLRYIIIIAVILAIVVFLGGQVLQYQKSKD